MEYTRKEMLKEIEKEKGKPVKTQWFKHKNKDIYKNQIDIFNEMLDYEEV